MSKTFRVLSFNCSGSYFFYFNPFNIPNKRDILFHEKTEFRIYLSGITFIKIYIMYFLEILVFLCKECLFYFLKLFPQFVFLKSVEANIPSTNYFFHVTKCLFIIYLFKLRGKLFRNT